MDVPHEMPADGQKPESRKRFFVIEFEAVGGDLLHHEAVEWQVAVERPDHVIAVRPRPRILFLLEEDVPLIVRVSGHIEPVSPPALAVSRRSEQAIDDLLVGVRRRVRLERGDFGGRRWQAVEIEREAANLRTPIRHGRRRQFLLGKLRSKERIDGVARAVAGNFWPLHRTKRPVFGGQRLDLRRREQYRLRGPRCAHRHPFFECSDVAIGKFLIRGHLHFTGMLHRGNESAFGRFSGDNRGAIGATLDRRGARIEPQPRLLNLRPMARYALLDEYRADRLLEEGFTNRVGNARTRRKKYEYRSGPTNGVERPVGMEKHSRSPELAWVGRTRRVRVRYSIPRGCAPTQDDFL